MHHSICVPSRCATVAWPDPVPGKHSIISGQCGWVSRRPVSSDSYGMKLSDLYSISILVTENSYAEYSSLCAL